MMKQPEQWDGNVTTLFSPELVEQLKSHHTINDLDRMSVLTENDPNAPCKMARKKMLLSSIMAVQASLLEMTENVDLIHNTNLRQSFIARMPSTLSNVDNVQLG